jgi:excisionase family DNA binding protein
MSSLWMTVAAVAESEGVSARTVLRWIEQGHLRARRQPGGRLRIHADWYSAMVEQGESLGRILAAVGDEGDERP